MTMITQIKRDFETVIGIEVHAQLATATKIWCCCKVDSFSHENDNICAICTGQPGTLPVLNRSVLEFACKMGMAIGAKINQKTRFDRKNYFYPDLPKGYQITQFDKPIAEFGSLEIDVEDVDQVKKIQIQRIQIEEDTGKSTHGEDYSHLNFNRCGTPLIEIISAPDMRSGKEAVSYLKKLYAILTCLEICKGNLQDGNFRADVNLSLRPRGSSAFGTRTEIKNLNSFKAVEKAIEVETIRQMGILESGKLIEQQTLHFDLISGELKVLRTKSDANDYRYFPEPDLPSLVVTDSELHLWRQNIPELPDAMKLRFIKDFSLPASDASVLVASKDLARYFENAVTTTKAAPKKVANWLLVELLHYLHVYGTTIEKSPVTPSMLGELLDTIEDQLISGKIAKDVLPKMFETRKNAKEIIDSLGLSQITESDGIQKMVMSVLEQNPAEVQRYRAGEKKLFGFFMGEVMKMSQGKAGPSQLKDCLMKALELP